ncbi:hypothetical protein CHS0354_010882 [Potamilus streckersoni]|uniref:Uncharacterized protein n=1 Tax=Potamilus streckersoni TaxID=2493646 RepID=A0AAE0VYE8_9BIVA|nr:hypothetical protein CHS0354_010882 [Potamilus streckersoni]
MKIPRNINLDYTGYSFLRTLPPMTVRSASSTITEHMNGDEMARSRPEKQYQQQEILREFVDYDAQDINAASKHTVQHRHIANMSI